MEGVAISYAIIVALVPLCGLLMAVTPWLLKKSECFAVTVPQSAVNDSRLVVLKKRYSLIVCLVTAVSLGITLFALTKAETDPNLFAGLYFVAVLLPEAVGFALMLVFRRKIEEIKFEESWVPKAHTDIRSTVLGNEEDEAPQAISMLWNMLYLPVLVIAVVVPLVGYETLPQQIAMHAGFDGQVNGYAEKSLLTVLFPAIMDVFLIACFVFSHFSIKHSKKANEPGSPRTSEYAYGMFARAESILLVASGLLICIAMTAALLLSFFGYISLMAAANIILIAVIPIVVGSVVVTVVYGQNGSRLYAKMGEHNELLCDDDRFWKLGIFYFNPGDPAVFLTKRFGVGWTFNYARPATWVLCGGFLVLTVGLLIVCCLMM